MFVRITSGFGSRIGTFSSCRAGPSLDLPWIRAGISIENEDRRMAGCASAGFASAYTRTCPTKTDGSVLLPMWWFIQKIEKPTQRVGHPGELALLVTGARMVGTIGVKIAAQFGHHTTLEQVTFIFLRLVILVWMKQDQEDD